MVIGKGGFGKVKIVKNAFKIFPKDSSNPLGLDSRAQAVKEVLCPKGDV